uniref:Uncharacterized protein n=1 Tax=Cacopsylla melanoneura TaxID=428564 RepID=A0A8D9BTD9_9HEMI
METDLLILVVTLTTRQGSVIMMTRKRWLRARCDRDGFPIGRFEPRRKRSSVCPNKEECVPLESDEFVSCFENHSLFLQTKCDLHGHWKPIWFLASSTTCLQAHLSVAPSNDTSNLLMSF